MLSWRRRCWKCNNWLDYFHHEASIIISWCSVAKTNTEHNVWIRFSEIYRTVTSFRATQSVWSVISGCAGEFAGYCRSISVHSPSVSSSGNQPGRHSSTWWQLLSALTITDDGRSGWECVCMTSRLVCCAKETLLQVGKLWPRKDRYPLQKADVRGHKPRLQSVTATGQLGIQAGIAVSLTWIRRQGVETIIFFSVKFAPYRCSAMS